MFEPQKSFHPPREVASYDDFLGCFVDAVQVGRAGVPELRAAWVERCPAVWRDRFAEDLCEIESLLAAGAMVRVGAA
jgi:hypothetical protein